MFIAAARDSVLLSIFLKVVRLISGKAFIHWPVLPYYSYRLK
ncbi:hypothetical protein (plasmid) [Citrobacter freundii]|nr:hypothetical protein [Citrobacter freundii]